MRPPPCFVEVTDIDPVELARQLCLIESRLFQVQLLLCRVAAGSLFVVLYCLCVLCRVLCSLFDCLFHVYLLLCRVAACLLFCCFLYCLVSYVMCCAVCLIASSICICCCDLLFVFVVLYCFFVLFRVLRCLLYCLLHVHLLFFLFDSHTLAHLMRASFRKGCVPV